MKSDSNGIPEHIIDAPIIPRATSEDMTRPMRSIEHRVVRQDGPPDAPEVWDDDTDVDFDADTIIFDVRWAS